jgi:hypothetical protein
MEIEMTQYYIEKDHNRHWLVKATTGQNSEIVASATSKQGATAIVRRLNQAALEKGLG